MFAASSLLHHLVIGRVVEIFDFLGIADLLEVSVDICRLRQVNLRLQVLVAKLDCVLALIDLKHLDLAECPTRWLLLHLLFLLLGALSLIIILSGYRRELGLELQGELRAANLVLNVLVLEVFSQLDKELHGLASHEELGEVLHEVGAVLVDVEIFPRSRGIFNLAFFLCGICSAHFVSSALIFGVLTASALFAALAVGLLVDELLAHGEVRFDLLITGHGALHPGVGADLVDCGALLGVQSHHSLEEILELGRVKVVTLLSIGVCLPENVSTVGCQQAVVGVLWVGRGEGWALSQDHEQDDSAGKQIDASTFVRLAKVDLWCHV